MVGVLGGVGVVLAAVPTFFIAKGTLTPWWLNLIFMLRYLLSGVMVWALLSKVADNAEAIRSSRF